MFSVRILLFALLVATPAFAHSIKATAKDSWASLAAAHYGSAHYGPVLAELNGQGKRKLKAGTTVDVPPFAEGMAKLKFDPAFEGLLRQLATAATGLSGVANELRTLPSADGGQASLPTPLRMRLSRVSSDLDEVRSGSTAVSEKYEPPRKAIADLREAVTELNGVLAGKATDLSKSKALDLSKSVDAVHRRIAAAMLEIIRWTRAGFRP